MNIAYLGGMEQVQKNYSFLLYVILKYWVMIVSTLFFLIDFSNKKF